MESGVRNYDLQLMQSLVEETQYLLNNTWEFSLLSEAQAEAVAFLVATTRYCPAKMTQEHVENVLKFWNITLADVEAVIFELLHIHEEEITDGIEEDLYVLNLVFPSKN
ncbi:MAG: hypothetical protein RBG13Loki_1193 [Promethearchaeota archaeon CR_4]|nr:MAG: hypothetical protein RBG13Loki_1193 [Candidatus Lokiarchaeota archaeon CR_4]